MTLANLVGFHEEIDQLKRTLRFNSCKGNKAIQDSVAGHSWNVALLTLGTIKELDLQVNTIHSLELALVHDLSEYQMTSDFDSYEVANGKFSKEDKDRQEQQAIKELTEKYNMPSVYRAWQEYEVQKTPEARLVKTMDKIEAIIHMINTGATGRQNDDEHTALYADQAVINFPEVTPLLRQVKSRLKVTYEQQDKIWLPKYDKV